MLINPSVETDSDIAWICDGCGKMLNIQPGFKEECGEWKCVECGHINKIDPDDLYASEDEYQADLKDPYRGLSDEEVLEIMGDKPVIIRTLDIGADKKADYLGLKDEENPAMGLRAIRLCLTKKDIFKTQLRALLRASEYGNLHIMYPMITSGSELDKIDVIYKEVLNEVKPKKLPKIGIMIETPAAAIISDKLAKRVDFFSIGTNDLTQYTLAMDRQGENLDEFFDPHHEAVLQLIRITIDNAHKEGIWAGICGELAAEESLTHEFIKMGVDELSVSPAKLLNLRKAIISES